jgi:hypothetical protein
MAFSIKIAGATFTKAVAFLVRYANLVPSGLTESGNDSSGYSYTGSGNYANTSNYKVLASTEGYVSAVVTSKAAAAVPVLIAASTNNITSYSDGNSKFGIYVASDAGNVYRITASGIGSITANVVAARIYAAGDVLRIRRLVNGSCVAEISSDNGITFTLIHNYTAYAGDLFPAINVFGDTVTVSKIAVSNVVAV